MLSGQLAQGEEVERFEEEVAAFVGRRFGVAVSSGTAALHLALLALDVKESGEVLLPSYVCTALLHAVQAVGGRSVVADIDRPIRNSRCLAEVWSRQSRHDCAAHVRFTSLNGRTGAVGRANH